ncbi:MAG: tRNA 2-thiouridine(34) synthase MnmA, partial [Gammaproteobacteria bacterium]|nr:tRNA 2-thiouridine(34) synthase MnmA [Gammaproteobacteria bacterium]
MKKIIVGMSGGVDSSVSALLLKEQGYEVTGIFMKNWEETDSSGFCPAAKDALDAKAVADKIGIPLETVNFSDRYWDKVFEYFLAEYRAGRTPNPDILCNKEIKFRAFLDLALSKGADAIATGHYARRRDVAGKAQLLKGLDPEKDQSYFLYALDQAQLSRSLFPVGELKKSKVREMAKAARLITHNKKDSTGICFIGERRFKTFLSQYLPAQPGLIEDEHGTVIGEHDGLMYYTLGQRQGLKIGGLQNRPELPWYVAEKDLTRNVLIAVQGHDHPLLLKPTLKATHLTWIAGEPPAQHFEVTAKTRYRQADQPCLVELIESDIVKVSFKEPQWAVTPGQSIVRRPN